MKNEDFSRLASFAEAIVAEPNSISDWIIIMNDSTASASQLSTELMVAIDVLWKVLKSSDHQLGEMLEVALRLENEENGEPSKLAGRALRWAIQKNLLAQRRRLGRLDSPSQELLHLASLR